jgi:hypothetical protein
MPWLADGEAESQADTGRDSIAERMRRGPSHSGKHFGVCAPASDGVIAAVARRAEGDVGSGGKERADGIEGKIWDVATNDGSYWPARCEGASERVEHALAEIAVRLQDVGGGFGPGTCGMAGMEFEVGIGTQWLETEPDVGDQALVEFSGLERGQRRDEAGFDGAGFGGFGEDGDERFHGILCSAKAGCGVNMDAGLL